MNSFKVFLHSTLPLLRISKGLHSPLNHFILHFLHLLLLNNLRLGYIFVMFLISEVLELLSLPHAI
jgi:hypothetical protein